MPTKEQKRKWAAADYKRRREYVLGKANEYYAENREAVKAKRRERHRKKLESEGRVYRPGAHGMEPQPAEQKRAKKRAYIVKWRKKNPEKHKAQTRRHYANTKEYFKANARKRRYQIKGVPGEHTKDDIAWLRKQQKGKCVFCLEPFGDETPDIDHYLPIALGGRNDRKNLRLLHARCNRRKNAKHPQDFGLSHGLLAW